jgi:hypothetical protein
MYKEEGGRVEDNRQSQSGREECTVDLTPRTGRSLPLTENLLITVITGKLDPCGEARARTGSLGLRGCETNPNWAELSTATAACPLGQGGKAVRPFLAGILPYSFLLP